MNWKKQVWQVLVLGAAFVFASGSTWAKDEKHEVHWTYQGATGPDHWGEFFETCGKGQTQSPIDIKGPFKNATEALKVDYKESALKILNNGHTIQVNYEPGSTLTVKGESYDLLQFHFHKPSEEKIEGKAKAMVAHLVHKSKAGKLAVIGVLLEEGTDHPLIKTLWANLPKEENKEQTVADAKINVKDLLPSNLGYYHYMGSLTTPPCTEGVAFYILKNFQQVSKTQVDAFPFVNARPTQPLNGREIEAFAN